MKSELHLNLPRPARVQEKEKEKEVVREDPVKIKQMEEKIDRLEAMIQKMQILNIHDQKIIV